MDRGKRFVKALASVAVFGWILGMTVTPQAKMQKVVPSWRPEEVRARPATPRSSREVSQLVYTLGTDDEIFLPAVIKADAQENLYVLDYGDHRIKKYGPGGERLATYGRGQGAEPGHFVNPTDFAWTAAGDLWVADPDSERVIVFAPDGRLRETLTLETTPYRLAIHPDGSFFVISNEPGELFEEYGTDRRLKRRFGRLLEATSQSSIALDGWIEVTGAGRLAFAPRWLDVFALYDRGERVLLAETVDGAPLPEIVLEEEGWESMNPRAWVVNRSLSVAGSEIFLHTIRGRGPDRQALIDVFDAAGGYSESLLLPEPCATAVASAGSVFTIHRGLVQRWRRPRRAPAAGATDRSDAGSMDRETAAGGARSPEAERADPRSGDRPAAPRAAAVRRAAGSPVKGYGGGVSPSLFSSVSPSPSSMRSTSSVHSSLMTSSRSVDLMVTLQSPSASV